MISSPLDDPPPPSRFRRPWSPDPYDPLPTSSSQFQNNQDQETRREPSDYSVEALDLADYARTLAARAAQQDDQTKQYNMPAFRAHDDYPPSPTGLRPLASSSRGSAPPPSLVASASTSNSRSHHSSSSRSAAPHRRPFSLPAGSDPLQALELQSRSSHASKSRTNPSLSKGAPETEIDITQFPAFTRGWYAKQPKPGDQPNQDPFAPSNPNIFDPSFPVDTYRPDQFPTPRLGDFTSPPSYSNGSKSSRNMLPWGGDPADTEPPLDADVKAERVRMLEREFNKKGKGKGLEEGEKRVGSVDEKGILITEGPIKRKVARWFQVFLALLIAGSTVYAAAAIKPSSPPPPSGKPPLYVLYVLSIITFLVATYMFLIHPCCGARKLPKDTPYTQGPGGMMVLPVQGFPGGKKKAGKKKKGEGPGGDVQVNLIVDPGMFGHSQEEEDDEEENGSEFGEPPGTYTSSSRSRGRRKGGPRRRSVFEGLALEARWKRARKWLKWGMAIDVLCMVLWGGEFVFILLGKRCAPGLYEGWCDSYNISTAAACLLALTFALSVYFDIKDLHVSRVSPRTRA